MAGFGPVFELSSLDGSNGFRIDGEADFDASGVSVASAGDVNGDGFDDIIIGAPNADAWKNNSGASYVVFGQAGGFASSIELSSLNGTNGFKIRGETSNNNSGLPVASAGDVNGDGFDDLIIGAIRAGPSGTPRASYVVFGHPGGFLANLNLSALDGTNGFQINGEQSYGVYAAVSLQFGSAGDVNGDGFDDLIVGAPQAGPNGDLSGASYVVFGQAGGFAANFDLSTLNGTNGFQINGEAAGDGSGISVAGAGDVNDDGFDDLIIGAPGANPNGSDYPSGASYVVFGQAGGSAANFELSSLNGTNGFQINGDPALAYNDSGDSVASAGDVNGDGFDDLIINAPDIGPFDYAGASYVVFGQAGGFAANVELSSLNGTNGFRISGGDFHSIASAGDVNGDGFDDLILGDPNESFYYTGPGASYVVFGKPEGFSADLDVSTLNGTNGFQIDGSGGSVASAGDVNGDGYDDLIIGGANADLGGNNRGASYVVFGEATAPVTRVGTGSDDRLFGGDFADSLDGKGGNDLLTGLDSNDTLNGGDGHDKMVGGNGNDTYVVDSSGDVVVEEANGGTDTVQSSVIYTLGSNLNNLTLTGSSAINGTGNSAANVVTGNSAGNVLRGLDGNDTLNGGAGHDKMVGGDGDDTYVVDSSGDVVRERSDGGIDTVQASVSYVLGGNQNKLTLTGSSAINGTGNTLGNTLTGNDAKNTLDGDDGDDKLIGGGGNDKLTGGADADTFIFHDGDGSDTVTDFEDGIDQFDLRGVAGVDDRGDLHLTDTGADVLVDYGTGSFLVQNVAGTSLLDAGDFVFA